MLHYMHATALMFGDRLRGFGGVGSQQCVGERWHTCLDGVLENIYEGSSSLAQIISSPLTNEYNTIELFSLYHNLQNFTDIQASNFTRLIKAQIRSKVRSLHWGQEL